VRASEDAVNCSNHSKHDNRIPHASTFQFVAFIVLAAARVFGPSVSIRVRLRKYTVLFEFHFTFDILDHQMYPLCWLLLQEDEQGQVQQQETEQVQQQEQEHPAAVDVQQTAVQLIVNDGWTRYGASCGDLIGAISNNVTTSTTQFVTALDATAEQQVPLADGPKSNVSFAAPAAASKSLATPPGNSSDSSSNATTSIAVTPAAFPASPVPMLKPATAADSIYSGNNNSIAASGIKLAASAEPKKQGKLMKAIRAMIRPEPNKQGNLMKAIQAMIHSQAAPQPAESEGPKQPGFVVRAPSGVVVTPIVLNYEAIEKDKGTTTAVGNYRRSSGSSGGSSAGVQGVQTPSRGSDAGLSRQSSLSSTSSV
jgi:hypothetical protein